MEQAAANQALARAVQEAVTASGKSLREVSAATDIRVTTLHSKLRALSPITYPELVAISKALGTTVAELDAAAAARSRLS